MVAGRGCKGLVRFIGSVDFVDDMAEWYGVELDSEMGRHDGTVQGVRSAPILFSNHLSESFRLRAKNLYPTENGQHPPCHLKLSCLTQPLPACLVGSYTDRQSKERLLNLRRRGDRILSVLSRIYSIFFGFEAAIKQLC